MLRFQEFRQEPTPIAHSARGPRKKIHYVTKIALYCRAIQRQRHGHGVSSNLVVDSICAKRRLGLDRAARREIQRGLQAQGFYPGGVDGMFGPRTRAAIQSWQRSQGARPTGYLDGASVGALRPSGFLGQPTFRERERPAAGTAVASSPAAVAAVAGQQPAPPTSTAEQENLFWQSTANSTNPAEFEAYLRRFPNGTFSELAQIRLEALRAVANDAPVAPGRASGR